MAIKCAACGAIHFHPKGAAPTHCRDCNRDLAAQPDATTPTPPPAATAIAAPRHRRPPATLTPNWPAMMFGVVVAVGGAYGALTAPKFTSQWESAPVKYDTKFIVTSSKVSGMWREETGYNESKGNYRVNGKSYPVRMYLNNTIGPAKDVWYRPSNPADYRSSKPTEVNAPLVIACAVALLGAVLTLAAIGVGTDALLVREPVRPAEPVA